MNRAQRYERYARGGPEQEQSEAGYAIGEERESRSQRQSGQRHRVNSFVTGRIPRGWNCYVPLSGYLRTALGVWLELNNSAANADSDGLGPVAGT